MWMNDLMMYYVQWDPDISGLPVYSISSMESRLKICKKCGSAGKLEVVDHSQP